MKIVKKIAIALLVVLIGMQFYRPEKNQAEGDYVAAFETDTEPSAEVKQILRSACYDCHSANTEYPWYNNVAPVSYWLADHIKDGKKHLNFSDWENYTVEKKDHKLEEVVEEVKKGEMPLKEYTWTHGDARLTQDQIIALVTWADGARAKY
ncbi:cytochrome C [Flagellimonas taeanensis]|uniref:heme-binding domain-containing protein n=1 Tax=Flavobacteriaceae TaxID=49546 RepID=UPI000E685735|nr:MULTISPECIES: heme-binding domain-containing protein [Allomuricauda]MDC6384868.1 heme-binding domain-containing protein [Muricauda sp. SK9]MEE1962547.1 heme-binding domain-containing protein [Allomuricauda taeanensis]RIV53406.1 cytochrome C [Allomuricauda taeanensis]